MTIGDVSNHESPARTQGTTLSEHCAGAIREMILWEAIPPGTPLSEVKLAQHLGVSRTPVREALRSLQSEGMAVRRGARLIAMPFEREYATELLTLRQMVEPFVAAESARRLDRRAVSRLRAVVAQMEDVHAGWDADGPREIAELELEFHQLLNSACPYRKIADVVENARDARSLLRMYRVQTEEQRAKSVSDHVDLVGVAASVASGDAEPEAMKQAMAEHLGVSMDYLHRYVEPSADKSNLGRD